METITVNIDLILTSKSVLVGFFVDLASPNCIDTKNKQKSRNYELRLTKAILLV